MKQYLVACIAGGVLLAATAAQAQMYHPYNPSPYAGGPAQTTITPIPFGGGYRMTTPRVPDTTMTPIPFGGGYNITTPGQPSRTLTPIPFGGGWRLQ